MRIQIKTKQELLDSGWIDNGRYLVFQNQPTIFAYKILELSGKIFTVDDYQIVDRICIPGVHWSWTPMMIKVLSSTDIKRVKNLPKWF